MEWVWEVEKNVVEMFMYLNTTWVLKSIGYVAKDIWNSTNQEWNMPDTPNFKQNKQEGNNFDIPQDQYGTLDQIIS